MHFLLLAHETTNKDLILTCLLMANSFVPETKGRTLEGLDRVFEEGSWEFAIKAFDEGKRNLKIGKNTVTRSIDPENLHDRVPLGPWKRQTFVNDQR